MDSPEFEEAKQRAAEFAAVFAGLAVQAEAELAVRGIYPVSVVHGYAEDEASSGLIYGRLPRLAEESGQLAGARGGNDYTTWLFSGPDAANAALRFTARVDALDHPSWWRVTPTATPVYQ